VAADLGLTVALWVVESGEAVSDLVPAQKLATSLLANLIPLSEMIV